MSLEHILVSDGLGENTIETCSWRVVSTNKKLVAATWWKVMVDHKALEALLTRVQLPNFWGRRQMYFWLLRVYEDLCVCIAKGKGKTFHMIKLTDDWAVWTNKILLDKPPWARWIWIWHLMICNKDGTAGTAVAHCSHFLQWCLYLYYNKTLV